MRVQTTKSYNWQSKETPKPESVSVSFNGKDSTFLAGDGKVESYIPGAFRSLDDLSDLLSPKTASKLKGYQIDRAEFLTYNAPLELEINNQQVEVREIGSQRGRSYLIEHGSQTITWTPGREVRLESCHASESGEQSVSQSIVGQESEHGYICAQEGLRIES